MFCRNCGVKLEDDARFCQNCGTPVEEEPVQQKESKFKQYRSEVKSEMKSEFKNFLTTAVLALIAIGITWVILSFFDKDSEKTETAAPQISASQNISDTSEEAAEEYWALLDKYGYDDESLFENASSVSYLDEGEYGLTKTEYVHNGQFATDLVFYFYWDVSYETPEEIQSYVESFYEGTYFVGDGYYVTVSHYENLDEESGLRAFYNPEPGETVEKITVQELMDWSKEETAVYIR